MERLNIKFADGNEFIGYEDDSYNYAGCPTCDYGSEYINDVEVNTTNYRITATFNRMYEYAFSTAEAIRIFAVDLKNMTEKEFVDHIDKEFHEIGTLEKFEIHQI